MRDLPKVCEHIHLPVQSGDDDVLESNEPQIHVGSFQGTCRGPEVGRSRISRSRRISSWAFRARPTSSSRTRWRLVEEVRFDSAFMFAYNVIPNTAAARWAGSLEKAVKNARLGRLIELQNAITCEINDQSGRPRFRGSGRRRKPEKPEPPDRPHPPGQDRQLPGRWEPDRQAGAGEGDRRAFVWICRRDGLIELRLLPQAFLITKARNSENTKEGTGVDSREVEGRFLHCGRNDSLRRRRWVPAFAGMTSARAES